MTQDRNDQFEPDGDHKRTGYPEDAVEYTPDETDDSSKDEVLVEATDDVDDDSDIDDEGAGSAPVPLFPKLAGWFAFLLPPVGAIMGHLWLAWEGKEKDVVGRRHAMTGIIVGWFMTFVVTVVGLIGYATWEQSREADRVQESQEQIAEEELAQILALAESSDSLGEVDAVVCDALFTEVIPAPSPSGFVVTEYDHISDELISGYRSMAEGESPYAELYGDYADRLAGFESEEEFNEHLDANRLSDAEDLGIETDEELPITEEGFEVISALDADSLSCVDYDEDYFFDHIADRNTYEFG